MLIRIKRLNYSILYLTQKRVESFTWSVPATQPHERNTSETSNAWMSVSSSIHTFLYMHVIISDLISESKTKKM